MAHDHYKTLGVSRKATEKEIKQAYRRLARQLHPDVTGDDPAATERFKLITEAYDTLSDPKRRKSYDLFGRTDEKGMLEGFDLSTVMDSVKRAFARGPDEPVPGADMELSARISFREAYRGVKRALPITLTRPCSACGATGLVDERTCKACSGRKARIQTEDLVVTFPAGVDEGTRLRLKERGAAGQNLGPCGDLYLNVEVEPDERFERDGADLFTEVRVGLKDALLGAHADVPLPDGARVTINVPPGTQGGQVFRVPGRGFARLPTGARGDLFVTVQVRLPKKLGADGHALLQELAEVVPDL